MGSGWDGDEVAAGAVLAVNRLDELLQGVGVGLRLERCTSGHLAQ